MKLNKEYPATHSMETAWYVADEEGNVAIFDFEEYGPVPWGVEETEVSELVFGHEENYNTHEYLNIDLTDDQVDDLIEKPHSPEEENIWFECAVEIDTSKEKEFLDLAAMIQNNNVICISQRRGLYRVDFFDDTEESKPKKDSALQKMIDRGIVKRVYRTKQFWMNDEPNETEDGFKFKKDFKSAPYFIYHEPYWPELLQKRVIIPSNPVKLEQVPQPLRERIPVLPVKFVETEYLQIAEYLPSHFCAVDGNDLNGYEYMLAPTGDGVKSWVLSDILFPVSMENCFENGSYRCKKCKKECWGTRKKLFTHHPTVLIIFHPFYQYDYNLIISSNPIIKCGVLLPLLFRSSLGSYDNYTDWYKIKETVSDERFASIFKQNGFTFEHTVNRFRPHVILADEWSLPILREKYGKAGRTLVINKEGYPLYSMQELETLNDEIEAIARKPYRGEVMPQVISVEEMKKLHSND